MGCQDGVKRIRHKQVCVLRIGLMHVYHSMYFHSLLWFVIHVLLFDQLGDLLMYLSLSVIRCILGELLHVCQTVNVWIGKGLPNQATAYYATLHTGFTLIGSSHEI